MFSHSEGLNQLNKSKGWFNLLVLLKCVCGEAFSLRSERIAALQHRLYIARLPQCRIQQFVAYNCCTFCTVESVDHILNHGSMILKRIK